MIATPSAVLGGTGYQPVAVGNLPAALVPQGLLKPSLTGDLGANRPSQIKPKYWDSLLQSAADQTYIGRSKSVLASPGQSQRKNFIKPTRQNTKIIGQTNKNSPKNTLKNLQKICTNQTSNSALLLRMALWQMPCHRQPPARNGGRLQWWQFAMVAVHEDPILSCWKLLTNLSSYVCVGTP